MVAMAQRSPSSVVRRPSRREYLIGAAVEVFAREGFQAGSVIDVAEEAAVVPTAVYYHFGSKEELYEAALERVLGQVDEVVEAARTETDGSTAPLGDVIGAVWDWVEDNPVPARLLYHQLPGSTPRALELRREFEERHVARAIDYFPELRGAKRSEAAARRTSASIAMRAIVHLGMNTHSLRMGDGPLAKRSERNLRSAYIEMSERLISAAMEA